MEWHEVKGSVISAEIMNQQMVWGLNSYLLPV